MLLSSVPSFFKHRRDQLLKKAEGAVFLLPAAEEVLRNLTFITHFGRRAISSI